MAIVQTLIGNVKGPQGETGATGATGAKGDAATITVGSVSTTAYGNAAKVENVGTENDAILNFTIPQGKPGEKTTTMSGLTLDTVTTSADEFPVPAVGENGATVWGKVIKFFRDTIAALTSKLDANKVVNSQTVTEAGYALDAQQANPNVSGSLAAQISGLNDSLANSLTNRTISVTPESYVSAYYGGPVIMKRSGNAVTVYVSFQFDTERTGEVRICTYDTTLYPGVIFRFAAVGTHSGAWTAPVSVWVDDGFMRIVAGQGVKHVIGCGTYLI